MIWNKHALQYSKNYIHRHTRTYTNTTNCILDLSSYKRQTWGTHVPMTFDLRVDPPGEMSYGLPMCDDKKSSQKHAWRWYFNVTSSREFRLHHLNGSSDSIGRWENTNTRFQKDKVNDCFISTKCVWKPELTVSKTNKNKGTRRFWFWYCSVISIFWLAATSPACVAKVTDILVFAKNILLLATGC